MSATQPTSYCFASIGCVVLVFFLSACATVRPADRAADTPPDGQPLARVETHQEDMPPLGYSMVFMIHGDGAYRYHDTDGNAFQADQVALAKALRVAQSNQDAEVFIFHEKKRKRRFGLFPRRDGDFYYFHHGEMVGRERYDRNTGESRYASAVALHNRFRDRNAHSAEQLFVYMGHEVPEWKGLGYDVSYPDRSFLIEDLAMGMRHFARDSTRFDLVVLSTCHNGTPHTVSSLAPFAKTVVASPENLHLSYFDLSPLERVGEKVRPDSLSSFASVFARNAFEALSLEIQTPISVVVYDVDRARGYLDAVQPAYASSLDTIKVLTLTTDVPVHSLEHQDCAADTAFATRSMGSGLEVFYRPSLFGRASGQSTHSGWECWILPDAETTRSNN